MSTQKDQKLCVIIGSGPAGYTAAIYAARANLKPVLYTGTQIGGQLTITTEVENYPGYPNGVLGPEMMEDLRKQAERFGTIMIYENIVKVDFSGNTHKIWTEGGDLVEAHAVIIATGASAKWLGIPDEQRLMNRGVSACAVCDGYFFRNSEVVVVGGGDTAAEEASYLAKLCTKVHLLVRRDEMRASKIMQERVNNTSNIQVHWNTEVNRLVGEEAVEGVEVRNRLTGETNIISAKALFIAIGHHPNTSIFEGWLEMDDSKYIITQGKTSKTNIEGVFACGDAQDKHYRQAVTAAGSGCIAALDAERYLTEKGKI